MAVAEEQDVLKYYFYMRYTRSQSHDMLLTEVIIDRHEKTIAFLFRYDDADLFQYAIGNLVRFMQVEGWID
jgi:hypothetical protein